MRKKIIDQDQNKIFAGEEKRLDVESLAEVEITSEDPSFPIESALKFGSGSGWRASKAGKQTVRIIFDEPQRINNVHLHFREDQHERSQEFVLQWAPENGQPYREIVRQQYNFSPGSTTEEQENYTLNLEGVKIVELSIVPDLSGSDARASLASLWFT